MFTEEDRPDLNTGATKGNHHSGAQALTEKQLLTLAENGLHLWPQKPGTKQPLTDQGHWVQSSRDPGVIEQWWAQGHRDWGVDCEASKIAVLDLDVKSANGIEQLDHLENDLGEQLSWGVTRLPTRSGGQHLVYDLPDSLPWDREAPNLRTRDINMRPGVDYVAKGNLKLHPSSELVEWIEQGCPRPALPATVRKLVGRTKRDRSASSTPSEVDDMIANGFPEGGRDEGITRLAGIMKRKTGSKAATLAACLQAAAACTPPFPEAQVIKCVESVFRYPDTQSATPGVLPDWAKNVPVADEAPPPVFVNLAQLYADGFPEPASPTVLRRDDGVGLFYEGKVNWLFGDSEAGKTWVALAAIVQVVRDGESAWFIDLDHNTAAAVVNRLMDLGLPAERLLDPARFRYAEPQDSDGLMEVLAEAKRSRPTLVVMDSMGEALSMLGANPNSDEDVTGVHTHLLKPFSQTGASVVVIDHLSRGSDSRAQGPTGTLAKKRMVSGSSLRVSAVRRFAPGAGGSARITIHKDRHGGLRARSIGSGQSGEPAAAVFEMEPFGGWSLNASQTPDLGGLSREHEEFTDLLVRVVSETDGLNTSQIAAKAKESTPGGIRNGAVNQALQAAEEAGRVRSEKVGRAVRWYPIEIVSSPAGGEDR